jgi:hypothetical protein
LSQKETESVAEVSAPVSASASVRVTKKNPGCTGVPAGQQAVGKLTPGVFSHVQRGVHRLQLILGKEALLLARCGFHCSELAALLLLCSILFEMAELAHCKALLACLDHFAAMAWSGQFETAAIASSVATLASCIDSKAAMATEFDASCMKILSLVENANLNVTPVRSNFL